MQITVLSATTETVPTAKGSYQKLELAYKDEQGQVKGKKIMSFGTSVATFKVLSKAQSGESYGITAVKNEQSGYWDWTNATKVDSVAGGANSSSVAPTSPTAARSNYETAEERARKQVYIVRQSSLSAAISFLNPSTNPEFTEQDVINVAKQFEAYVFDLGETPAASKAFDNFEDDVPL